jgi:REP element-mobilizing transposase RayT
MPEPRKGYGALRRGRHSAPGADYFLTLCLIRPSAALNREEVINRCQQELLRVEAEQSWTLRSVVFMPDHLHLLITLGPDAVLSAVVRLFKGRLTPCLRQSEARWQENYYDHQLYPEEDRLPVFLYIFLNPYRKNLIAPDQIWPGYFCAESDWAWFEPLTRESCPEPAWLR